MRRDLRTAAGIGVGAALFLTPAARAAAQLCPPSSRTVAVVCMPVNDVLTMEVVQTPGPLGGLDAPITSAGYGRPTGVAFPGPLRLRVRANRPWRLSVGGTISYSADGGPWTVRKATGDVLWARTPNAFTPTQALPESPGLVPVPGPSGASDGSWNPPTAPGGDVVEVYFAVRWRWTSDPPGRYTLNLQLTVAPP